VVVGDAELTLAHHHTVRLQPAELGLFEFTAVGQGASGEDDGHAGTGVGVGGAGHDLDDLPPTEVHLCHVEPVGFRVRAELDDLADHYLAIGHAETLDAVYFLAVQGDNVDELPDR
jgi:hypothetical protein